MKLWPVILPLYQELSQLTYNHALSYLSEENVGLVDSFNGDKAANHVIQERIEELTEIIGRCRNNIGDVKPFITLKEKFSELLMFVKLANRYPTRPVTRTKTPTPDWLQRLEVHGDHQG